MMLAKGLEMDLSYVFRVSGVCQTCATRGIFRPFLIMVKRNMQQVHGC